MINELPAHWILDEYLNIKSATTLEWAEFFKDMNQRRIAYTTVSTKVHVSTVFLGVDYSYGSSSTPVTFESLVFNGKHDGHTVRYTSYADAVEGHNKIVAMLLKTARKKNPIEHHIRKKLVRSLEYYKEDTKLILETRMKKVIKRWAKKRK